MRRRAQIAGAAGAAAGFGVVLWALAGADLPSRIGQLFSAPSSETSQPGQGGDQRKQNAVRSFAEPGARPKSAGVLAIEIARIDAGGASVLAGRSPPNHQVTVLANGREIASVTASDEGQWSAVVTEGIAAGPLELTISSRSQNGGPAVTGEVRQLTVPPAASSPRVAAVIPSAKISPPAKAPAPTRGGDTAQKTPGGDAADKRALAEFEALVARARSEMGSNKSPSPSAKGGPSSAPAGSVTGNPDAPPPVGQTTVAAAPATGLGSRPATDALPDPAQVPIPVPITFMTDDTTLTADGARAAALLAEYLRLKRPEAISLSGHADSRGPDSYNMELSRQRLEVIERYLRAAGYTGSLSLLPRGKREPYRGVDRARLSLEQIYQADRRVELRMTP